MLPGEELPLRIFEPRYTAMVSDCLTADDPSFGVVLIAAGREVGGGDARSDVGALAHIAECADFGDGRYRLRCVMAERIRVLEWHPDDPYPMAAVEVWPDAAGAAVDVDANPAVSILIADDLTASRLKIELETVVGGPCCDLLDNSRHLVDVVLNPPRREVCVTGGTAGFVRGEEQATLED